MTKTIGMAAATFLAVCGAFAALGDTVEEREKRTNTMGSDPMVTDSRPSRASVSLSPSR